MSLAQVRDRLNQIEQDVLSLQRQMDELRLEKRRDRTPKEPEYAVVVKYLLETVTLSLAPQLNSARALLVDWVALSNRALALHDPSKNPLAPGWGWNRWFTTRIQRSLVAYAAQSPVGGGDKKVDPRLLQMIEHWGVPPHAVLRVMDQEAFFDGCEDIRERSSTALLSLYSMDLQALHFTAGQDQTHRQKQEDSQDATHPFALDRFFNDYRFVLLGGESGGSMKVQHLATGAMLDLIREAVWEGEGRAERRTVKAISLLGFEFQKVKGWKVGKEVDRVGGQGREEKRWTRKEVDWVMRGREVWVGDRWGHGAYGEWLGTLVEERRKKDERGRVEPGR